MTENETIAWIFLATAMAAHSEPAGIAAISAMADAINHAIPTETEMRESLRWLAGKGLIVAQGKKYTLTPAGSAHYAAAAKQTTVLMKLWNRLSISLPGS